MTAIFAFARLEKMADAIGTALGLVEDERLTAPACVST
jgi:hypothetical protein